MTDEATLRREAEALWKDLEKGHGTFQSIAMDHLRRARLRAEAVGLWKARELLLECAHRRGEGLDAEAGNVLSAEADRLEREAEQS